MQRNEGRGRDTRREVEKEVEGGDGGWVALSGHEGHTFPKAQEEGTARRGHQWDLGCLLHSCVLVIFPQTRMRGRGAPPSSPARAKELISTHPVYRRILMFSRPARKSSSLSLPSPCPSPSQVTSDKSLPHLWTWVCLLIKRDFTE